MDAIKYYHELEQGSEAWHEARLGIVTASELNELVTPKTGKPTTGARVNAYAAQIASQRVNRCIEDNYESYDMMKGHFHEEYARNTYNDNYNPVKECGFITRKFDSFKLGCSPDGLVSEDGGIEVKSRKPKFQVATIVADEVPDEYVNQCQAFLLISGREWIDFVQYSTGMPMFVKRVEVDEKRRAAIIQACHDFEAIVQKMEGTYAAVSKHLVMTERVDFVLDEMITESTEEGE